MRVEKTRRKRFDKLHDVGKQNRRKGNKTMSISRKNIIKDKLEDLKITQKSIADKLGVSDKAVGNWLKGIMASKRIESYFKELCGEEFVRKLPAR